MVIQADDERHLPRQGVRRTAVAGIIGAEAHFNQIEDAVVDFAVANAVLEAAGEAESGADRVHDLSACRRFDSSLVAVLLERAPSRPLRLAGGLFVLMLDLGRPERMVVAATHYNFKSVFAWNVFLYSGMFAIVGVYLWTLMEPRLGRWSKPAGLAAFAWRIVLTTGTGSIFAFLVARQAYGSALLAPLFIVMSFAWGLAVFLVVLVFGPQAVDPVAVGLGLLAALSDRRLHRRAEQGVGGTQAQALRYIAANAYVEAFSSRPALQVSGERAFYVVGPTILALVFEVAQIGALALVQDGVDERHPPLEALPGKSGWPTSADVQGATSPGGQTTVTVCAEAADRLTVLVSMVSLTLAVALAVPITRLSKLPPETLLMVAVRLEGST